MCDSFWVTYWICHQLVIFNHLLWSLKHILFLEYFQLWCSVLTGHMTELFNLEIQQEFVLLWVIYRSRSAFSWSIYSPVSLSYLFSSIINIILKLYYINHVIWYQLKSHKYFIRKFVLRLKQNTIYEHSKTFLCLLSQLLHAILIFCWSTDSSQ